MTGRRAFLLSMLAAPRVARAQGGVSASAPWPNRPIRLIVPVAPGGSVDALARLLSRHLAEIIGQGFAVESHAGAGGNIAFELVARAAPDGHTLLAGWD